VREKGSGMGSFDAILKQLDEREIARNVGITHDEARMAYALKRNTVADFREFVDAITEYYSYHFSKCVAKGAYLTTSEAQGRAKEAVEQRYQQIHGGNLQAAYNSAHEGTNGGLRAVLDILAEQLKFEAIERYIRKVLDDQVDPTSWESKVDLVRQFIARCGPDLFPSIDTSHPERYAKDYTELIRSYVKALSQTSSIFRRM
jgi:hypothetical protein